MSKFENMVNSYNGVLYEKLPKFMKRRVDALRKIQLEHIQIQHQYHKELQELELKYEKLYKPLYDKRYKIINGEHVPTDEECQLPPNIEEDGSGDQENKHDDELPDFGIDCKLTPEEEKQAESQTKGIPGFWLGCLVSSYNFTDSVEDWDKEVLRYLKDIRLSYAPEGDLLTYTLEFQFADNPFFTNKVLTKKYFLKSKPDEKDPFSYEGFEVVKSEGCEINWNPGKNVAIEVKTFKQINKTDGRTRVKKREKERDSFFYFFKPPTPANENPDESDELDEVNALMAVDFELGELIRQSLIPKAVLYYNGYMIDVSDDDDDSLDEDDDDDDDDEDEEDSDAANDDFDSDMEDDSDESSDSLNPTNDKKKLTPNSKKSPKSKNN